MEDESVNRKATINFVNLMSEQDYSGTRANNQAKLALILFTYEMARRLDGTGVAANCLHPGAVATGAPLGDPDTPPLMRFFYRLMSPFFQRPEKGAATSIYLASSPEVKGVTGKYFVKNRAVASSPESYDVAITARLWQVSEELTNRWSDRAPPKPLMLDVERSQSVTKGRAQCERKNYLQKRGYRSAMPPLYMTGWPGCMTCGVI